VIRWEVGTTKNKGGRVLAFDALPALAEFLHGWRAKTDAVEAKLHRRVPWVFHLNGRPIKVKRFYKEWHAGCARAEVRNKIPHDLRRAAVMRFERAGVPRSVATSITGHRTESVYLRYNIVREVEQREGLKKVAALKVK
jgi:integrase